MVLNMAWLTVRLLFLILTTAYSDFDRESGGITGILGSALQEFGDAEGADDDGAGAFQVGDDGGCTMPAAVPMDIEWALNFSKHAKYIPMASQLYYATTARRLTGYALRSWAELRGMCLQVTTDPYGSNTITGLGHSVVMLCEIEWIGVLNCCQKDELTEADDCENSNETTRIVATWTDKKDYLLTISCQLDGKKSWNVVSTKKYMAPNARAEIIEQITQHHFDPENAVEICYDFC